LCKKKHRNGVHTKKAEPFDSAFLLKESYEL